MLSEDGQWLWTGTDWIPAPPTGAPGAHSAEEGIRPLVSEDGTSHADGRSDGRADVTPEYVCSRRGCSERNLPTDRPACRACGRPTTLRSGATGQTSGSVARFACQRRGCSERGIATGHRSCSACGSMTVPEGLKRHGAGGTATVRTRSGVPHPGWVAAGVVALCGLGVAAALLLSGGSSSSGVTQQPTGASNSNPGLSSYEQQQLLIQQQQLQLQRQQLFQQQQQAQQQQYEQQQQDARSSGLTDCYQTAGGGTQCG